MTIKNKEPVLLVIQLSGGNDFMNTVIPFTNGIYYDNRPLVGIPENKNGLCFLKFHQDRQKKHKQTSVQK